MIFSIIVKDQMFILLFLPPLSPPSLCRFGKCNISVFTENRSVFKSIAFLSSLKVSLAHVILRMSKNLDTRHDNVYYL